MLELNNISKIGVISDTHLDKYAGSLPPGVKAGFKDVSLIIHCGDVVCMEILQELETMAPVIAVKGNMDPSNLDLPVSQTMLINGKHILCAAHGSGSPFGITHRLYKIFEQYKPGLILFGHTHVAGDFMYNNTRLFNPGSPNTRSENFSIGTIDVTENELRTNVIPI